MSHTTVLLVRHAESAWNTQRRWQGHGDPPLTPVGRAQATALAAKLQGSNVDAIVASDLRRATETAKPLASVIGAHVQPDSMWREHDVGEWAGLTRREVRDRWPEDYVRFRSGDLDCHPGGGESRREFQQRVTQAMHRLVSAHAGLRVLVVTHRGVLRVLAPDVQPDHASLHRITVLHQPY